MELIVHTKEVRIDKRQSFTGGKDNVDCAYCTNCTGCIGCTNCQGCHSCTDCIDCYGLVGKVGWVDNKPVGPDEEYDSYNNWD
jgi:hypothetical protein